MPSQKETQSLKIVGTPPKATAFRVEWSDGRVWTAKGEVAEKVMEWYQSAEAMNCIHGAQYHGPKITISTLAEEGRGSSNNCKEHVYLQPDATRCTCPEREIR